MEDLNIKHVLVATGSPQANGQVERIHRTLTPMLAKFTENSNGKYWYHVLPNVEFAFNNTINKSIGEAPNTLLFGCQQRGTIIDKLSNYLDEARNDSNRNLELVREKAAT